MPKVSVVIPNYNHAKYLDERFASVLGQTFQDFEIVFLDDASTDDSLDVFEKHARHPKVRAHLNRENTGIAFKQWNKGVALAKGEYVWIAEADDSADPELLEVLVAKLDAFPSAGMAYCQSFEIDEDGSFLRWLVECTNDLDTELWKNDFFANGPDFCRNYLILRNVIPNASAVVFRRSVYERVGGADETLRLSGDWKVWIDILSVSDIAHSASTLNRFRSHPGAVRYAPEGFLLRVREGYTVLSHAAGRIEPSKAQRRKALTALADVWIGNMRSGAIGLFSDAQKDIWRTAVQVDRAVGCRLLVRGGRLAVLTILRPPRRALRWGLSLLTSLAQGVWRAIARFR